MENFCECKNFFQVFNDITSFFLKNYGKFFKIKGNNIKNKKSFNDMKNLHDTLISSLNSIQSRGNETLKIMEKCNNDHASEIEEITSKISKTEELLSKIENHYEKIKKEIPNEYEEEDDKDNNKNNYNDIFNNEKPLEEMTDEEIIERDRKTIILVQDLLNDAEFKAKKKEEKKEIIKIKNQLKDIVNNMEVELNKNDEQIDNIENNVFDGFEVIEMGNDNLQNAAQNAIKRRRVVYQAGLATVLGVAGSVVPGIGNLVGAAVGGLIGYGIYRIDKHRLNKIEEKKEQEKGKEKEKEKEKYKEDNKDKKKNKKK